MDATGRAMAGRFLGRARFRDQGLLGLGRSPPLRVDRKQLTGYSLIVAGVAICDFIRAGNSQEGLCVLVRP